MEHRGYEIEDWGTLYSEDIEHERRLRGLNPEETLHLVIDGEDHYLKGRKKKYPKYKHKTKQGIYSRKIGPNEMLIVYDEVYQQWSFCLTDVDSNEYTVGQLIKMSHKNDSRGIYYIYEQLFLNKNGEFIIPDFKIIQSRRSPYRIKIRKKYPRFINDRIIYARLPRIVPENEKYFIINRDTFFDSGGTQVDIIKRSENISLREVIQYKKSLLENIERRKNIIASVNELVGSIYDQENYEIIYESTNDDIDRFQILLRFPNLTVTNSIEQEHVIQELIVGLPLAVEPRTELFSLDNSLMGRRTIFTVEDLIAGYAHSHLGQQTIEEGRFCMGSGHILSGLRGSNFSMLDLESILIGIPDHVSWESLEGGPHIKMETIHAKNQGYKIQRGEGLSNPYDERTFKLLLEKITEKIDFNILRPAFSFSWDKNNNPFYVIDEKLFIDTIVKATKGIGLITILRERDTEPVVYDIGTKEFYSNHGFTNFLSRKKSRFSDFYNLTTPVYMNGRYIRPQIINREFKDNSENHLIKTPRREFFEVLMRMVYYHLFNEIKQINGRRK